MLDLAAKLQSPETALSVARLFVRHPALARYLQIITDNIDVSHTAKTATAFIGSRLAAAVAHSVKAIASLVVMLFLLFFLYRDGRQAVAFTRTILPLTDVETTILLQRTTDTIYATVLGRLFVATIQGALSGLAFWWFGVPGAFLWAVLTIVMAMIPGFGAVLVWAPITVYLIIIGHWGQAILLGVWGGGVVSLIDNILYPLLVGTRIRQNTGVILISILGGVALFGITGIILGPVLFTVAETLLEFWRLRMANADGQTGHQAALR
jgi:predicted PurR-regulated permease PerM